MEKKILSCFFVSILLITVVYGYSYSSKSLSIMGFDKDSSRTDVENTMKQAGIQYKFLGFGEFDRVFNQYGGGCTSIRNVIWKGMRFSLMFFYYTRNLDEEKLVHIEMILDESVSFSEANELFNTITKEYPERRTITWTPEFAKNETRSIFVKNGKNENESAVFELSKPYSYNFFFRGGQLIAYPFIDEW